LLLELETLLVGCNIGGVYINVLAYADDIGPSDFSTLVEETATVAVCTL